MARTRAFSDMRDDAYKLADQENMTGRFPAAEVGRLINQGNAELWDMLVAARGYSYYGKPWYNMGTVTGAGTTPQSVTLSGNPKIGTSNSNAFIFVIDIVGAGALGTGTFRYSTDNAATYTSAITLPSSGTYAIPSLGLTITFPSATYDADETYTSTASKPTTTANVATYALPVDFYKAHQLWLSDGANSYAVQERVMPIDEAPLRQLSSGSGYSAFVEYRDGYMDLLPPPGDDYTINLLYVPTCPVLVNDADTFDGINGWEDYPVAFAARRMALKDSDFELANMLQQEKNNMAERIRKLAPDRSSAPKYVQDFRGALPAARMYKRKRVILG